MNRNEVTKNIVVTAIVAGLYAVLTIAIAPLSYGAVQLRLSEVMTLLAVYDKKYVPGLILGCFIANIASPFGIVDMIVGTVATAVAVIMMTKIKNLFAASLMPTLANGLIIGVELHYLLALPLLETIFYIALGEFLVVSVIGVPLYKIFTSRLRSADHRLIK